MQLKGIVPDEHTCVAVLRACAKLGDVQTAYDALKDMKMHGLPMTVHTYSGLIKTYAGAAAVRGVKEEHVDMYIKDAMALFEQMKKEQHQIDSHVLNRLVELHVNALRTDELDANILPLYEQHNVKPDVFTYQRLARLYFNLADYKMVKNLYLDAKKGAGGEVVTPNKMLLDTVVQAALRTDDADMVYDCLQDYIAIRREPHRRALATLNNLKHMPDRLFVLLKENFGWSGRVSRRTREFELPTFRDRPSYNAEPARKKGRRIKPKKAAVSKTLSYADRRAIGKVM